MNTNANKTIAFYVGSLARGGAERVITNLAEYFHRSDYQVYIVTKLREGDEYQVSDGIHRIIADITEDEKRGRICNLFLRIRKLRSIFKTIHPSIIVSFIGKNNLMSIAAARPLKIPVVVSVRSNPAREIGTGFYAWLTKFLFCFSKGIVLQTNQARDFFPKQLQKKIVVLPNSVNPQFLCASYTGIRNKEIISVGRIDNNKNQKMLIEAFVMIADKYQDWIVKLYGDGEEKNNLEKYVNEKNLTKQVLFMGSQPDIQNHIDKSAIFTLTSIQEGLPNALIEAMILGLAVVSTKCMCGNSCDLICDDKNGILIPVNDTLALKNALCRLMDDEKLRSRLGKEAIKIRDEVSPEKVNQLWKNYLESLIKNK